MLKLNKEKIEEDWQQRAVDEYAILSDRIVRLKSFITTGELEGKIRNRQITLIGLQLKAMERYQRILKDRLVDLGICEER